MRRALVGAGVVMIVACGADSGTRDGIRSADGISNDYRARLKEVYAKGAREIVWPKCDTASKPPEAPCGYLSNELLSRERVDRYRSTLCNEQPAVPISDECFERFRRDFFERIGARYPRASADSITEQCADLAIDCSRFALLEIAALAAHNAAVRARVAADADALVAEHHEELSKRGRQVEAIEQARAREAAVWDALAVGLGGMARGGNAALSGGAQTDGSAQLSTPLAKECSSDFDCGFGYACVKAELQSNGICARAVDRNGEQMYLPPRGNYLPGGRGQCSFDTECPLGFRCLKNGALTGNCVK